MDNILKNIKKFNIKIFYSSLLFLITIIILYILKQISLKIFIYVIFLILGGILFYLLLYFYLNLNKNISSLISFLINYLILSFYLYSFYMLLVKGFPNPILVDNIPTFTKYRYLFYCIAFTIILTSYIFSLKYMKINTILEFFTYPYLKEEIRIILKKLYDNALGNFCVKLTKKLIKSVFFLYGFFIIHFIFIHIIKFIITLFFINFVFGGGDLRVVIYCLFLSFISWIFGFLFYYYSWFFEGNQNYLKACLNVRLAKNNTVDLNTYKKYIGINISDLRFKITDFGFSKGFSIESYPSLVATWIDMSSLDVKFTKYHIFSKFISFIISSLNIICWFYLSFKIFST